MKPVVIPLILSSAAVISTAAPSSADLTLLAPFPSLVAWEQVEQLIGQQPEGMIIVTPESSEIVVARIEKDGSRVMGCVDSAEAVQAFLRAPKADKEQ